MKIIKPIFILGSHRSGTSILHKLFTLHKDVAYFERYSNKFYKHPGMFRFIPILLKYQQLRYGIRPRPTEGSVWNRYHDSLSHLTEDHVTEEIKQYYYSVIKYELKAFNRKRFVNKNPKHSIRIRWLNKMFPDAYYILITRDVKAVINSMYSKMKRDRGWNYGHEFIQGGITNELIMEKFGKNSSQLEACINHYKYFNDTLNADLPTIKNKVKKITYENFVTQPCKTLKELFEFTELNWYPEIEKHIPELEQENNQKWKQLSTSEQELLLKVFPE